MNYDELDKKVQTTFLRSVSTLIGEMAQKHKLYKITTKVDVELLEGFRSKLEDESKYSSKLWCKFEFDIDEEQFEEILLDRIDNYRYKKPSFEQIKFYNDLCTKLGEEISVPNDYLEFTYSLQHLRERFQVEGPATDKQVEAIKKGWLKATGKELKTPDLITRGYVTEIFEKIAEMKKK